MIVSGEKSIALFWTGAEVDGEVVAVFRLVILEVFRGLDVEAIL